MPTPPKDQHDPFNSKRPVVFQLAGWRKLVFYPLAGLLWLYYRSLRIVADPADLEQLEQANPPRLMVTWHNRSLVVPEMVRVLLQPAQVACLISPSRMAAWEAALFQFLGFPVVRGSTTRRSIQAGIELLRAIRSGMDAGLTPDGPSGPLYHFQEGAAAIARKAGVPFVIMMPNCRWALRLRTWDRHLVPLPLAKVRVRVRTIHPDDPLWQEDTASIAQKLRRVCLELTEDPFKVESHEQS